MTCAEVQGHIPDAAAGRSDLPPDVAAHLAGCASCRTETESFRALLAADEPDPAYWTRVLPRLRRRIDAGSAPDLLPSGYRIAACAAVAALMVIVIPSAFNPDETNVSQSDLAGRIDRLDRIDRMGRINSIMDAMEPESVVDAGEALNSEPAPGGAGSLDASLDRDAADDLLLELLSEEDRLSLASAAGTDYLLAELTTDEYASLITELESR